VVFAASASKGWTLTGKNSPKQVDYVGCETVAKVAVEEKVPRVVVISSAYVTRPFHPIAFLLSAMFGRIMQWKRKGELATIAQTRGSPSTTYTIVRPGGLKNDPPLGRDWVRVGQGDNLGGAITRADVAAISVEAIFSDKAKNKVFEVVNFKSKPTTRDSWEDAFVNLEEGDGATNPNAFFEKEEL